LNVGALRSFIFIFFKFDKLKSVIELSNCVRSSLAADGGGGGDACETLDVSLLVFDDKDFFGVDVCNRSTVIEC
jgi:hypothetical protein